MRAENSKNLPTKDVKEVKNVKEVADVPKEYKIPLNRDGVSHRGGVKKLDRQQQLQVIDMIARGLTPYQVRDEVKRRTGVEISDNTVHYYTTYKGWKKKIKELKNYYAQQMHLVPGANKAVRLNRMEYVIDRASEEGDLGVVIKANEQQRREFEHEGGDVNNFFLNNPVYNQLNLLSNDELLKRHKEATERLMKGKINGPSRNAEKD